MRHIALLAAAITLLSTASSALAQGGRAGDIEIMHAWARATTTGVTAMYLKIANTGAAADRLLRAVTKMGRAEIHEMKEEGGVATMRPVDSIVIPAKTGVSVQPGGLHFMLTGLKQPLVEGSSFPVTFVFEKAGPISIDIPVQKAGSTSKKH